MGIFNPTMARERARHLRAGDGGGEGVAVASRAQAIGLDRGAPYVRT